MKIISSNTRYSLETSAGGKDAMSGEQNFTTELLLETTLMDFLQKLLESVGVRLL